MKQKKRKVCVVVTARPSYSRIKTAMVALRDRDDVELQVVVAASALLERYGRAIDVIRQDGFEVSASVVNVLEGEDLRSMAKTTGLGIIEMASVLDSLKPDVVVSVADRYETLATAVATSYMNIPLCHIQGGEVTGSIDEKVRHAITKLSDLHLVSNEKARDRVIHMGEVPEKVHVTGCPSIDIAAEVLAEPLRPLGFHRKYGGVGKEQDLSDGYVVVLQHPVTTEYEAARRQVMETLEAIYEFNRPTLWFWPNVDAGSDGTSKGIRSFRENRGAENIHYYKNMEPRDFLHLLKGSIGIVGNSSVAIRECSFLGVRAIDIGSRQSGRDHGANVVNVDYDRKQILQALNDWEVGEAVEPDLLYGDGKAGVRIADILATAELSTEKKLTY
ncbi:UDP-N-acetylglucosamine 2-epimerase [Puniceicoccus vermicola]|uniref:UDP-N-acetylglucosamine 2-epimerase (Hydrolyzing) n=1 Tax=Puniceicoccus vermicola TaxID=388746 RepID=A0A7X1AW81_9BACT|nr:UDP-N-acetylglucosamine 2-epimerase [Puniceicoccus vermicola]MBC2601092.1 UDP-N-acetylglucosamine 2-epimerase (hydrolyzing) [Puniceicoccus vermicola]